MNGTLSFSFTSNHSDNEKDVLWKNDKKQEMSPFSELSVFEYTYYVNHKTV
jgi:hypothetical protein